MRTRLLVCSHGLGCVRSVMDGFEFDWWDTAQAVHEPVGVVPVHPVGGEQFHVDQAMQRAAPKRRVIANRFGLVQPDRRLGQGVVVGLTG